MFGLNNTSNYYVVQNVHLLTFHFMQLVFAVPLVGLLTDTIEEE